MKNIDFDFVIGKTVLIFSIYCFIYLIDFIIKEMVKKKYTDYLLSNPSDSEKLVNKIKVRIFLTVFILSFSIPIFFLFIVETSVNYSWLAWLVLLLTGFNATYTGMKKARINLLFEKYVKEMVEYSEDFMESHNTQKGKIIKLILKAEEAKTKLYSIQKHIKEGPLF
jgi:hypothetical protein